MRIVLAWAALVVAVGIIGITVYWTSLDYRGAGQERYGALSLAERGDFWGGYISGGASLMPS